MNTRRTCTLIKRYRAYAVNLKETKVVKHTFN